MGKRTQVVVRPADMTLDELDEAQRLQEDGAGRLAAMAYVWLKRTDATMTLEKAGGMSWRQVRVDASDDDDDQEDDQPS